MGLISRVSSRTYRFLSIKHYKHHKTMGGDGGSIPTRRCLVKNKERQIIKDKRVQAASNYGYCQLSANRLKRPIIASRMGKLYNKDAVIEYLVDRGKNKDGDDKLDGCKSLKYDFFEIKLHNNSSFSEKNEPGTSFTNSFPFSCPVTDVELNGSHAVVFGVKSLNMVCLKALKIANQKILKTNKNDNMEPIFDPNIEDDLIDPVTSTKFGRPILMYPEDRNHLTRAHKYDPLKQQKLEKKKLKKLALEASNKKSVKFNITAPTKEQKVFKMKSPNDITNRQKIKQTSCQSTISTRTMKRLATSIANEAGDSKDILEYKKLK